MVADVPELGGVDLGAQAAVDKGLPVQVAPAQRARQAVEGIVAGADHAEGVGEQEVLVDVGDARRYGADADVHVAAEHCLHHSLGIHVADIQVELRVLFMELLEQRRQQGDGEGRHRRYAHQAGVGLGVGLDGADGAVEMCQFALGFLQHKTPQGAELVLAFAFEQGAAQLLFQLLERERHRRRCAVQALGGLGQALAGGHRDKKLQIGDLDAHGGASCWQRQNLNFT